MACLVIASLATRLVVELGLASTPSQKLLIWGTTVFDKMFDAVSAQTEEFQTEGQLLVVAALVSAVVKALESGSDTKPFWVGVRRVFAIFVASAVTIGFLLAFMGSWILLLGLAVGEDLIVRPIVIKTVLSWSLTIPVWIGARRVLGVFTTKGPKLPEHYPGSAEEIAKAPEPETNAAEPRRETGILGRIQDVLGRTT